MFAVIGDSIAAATHTSALCGNRDVVDCLETLAGQRSPEWNYADGTVSWSIASRLGFSPDRTINVADNGERWKDAFEQAREALVNTDVSTVLIGLGANDVCRDAGHDYAGDLGAISAEIDATLGFLTDHLPPHGEVFLSAVVDVTRVRDLMRTEDHSYVFESCQATWDLKGNQIKDTAAQSACDHFAGHNFCSVLDNTEDAKDYLLRLLLDTWLDLEGVTSGPCSKVLSENASDVDRDEARAFTRDLNRLIAEKARAFSGANGVEVRYVHALQDTTALAPHHISRFDCYHPSRTGQKLIADELWADIRPGSAVSGTLQTDHFDTVDYCATENDPWRSCWVETDNGIPGNGDVYIQAGRLRIKDNVRMIERQPDLRGVDQAWLSFNWRRRDLDRIREAVILELSADDAGSWTEVMRVNGDGDDYGHQRGDYFDVSAFANDLTRLRFRSQSLGNSDEVQLDNVTLFAWPSSPPAPPPAVRAVAVDDTWKTVEVARANTPPVIITGPGSYANDDPTLIEVINVGRDSFEVRARSIDASSRAGMVNVPILVLEPGVYHFAGDSVWESNRSTGSAWTMIQFTAPFTAAPLLMLEVQTAGDPALLARARNVTRTGFEFALFEPDGVNPVADQATVGFLAVESTQFGTSIRFADSERAVESDERLLTLPNTMILGAEMEGVDFDGATRPSLDLQAVRVGQHVFAREKSLTGTATLLRLATP